MNDIAIYAGSFDPVTMGHLDVIERAASIFGRLIVVVAENSRKETIFSVQERVHMLQEIVKDMDGVEVDSFPGLLVDYARQKGVHVLVRGLRAISDFEFEFQMALTNRKLEPDVETVFLMPREEYSYFNASAIREIAALGGDITKFVPPTVQEPLRARMRKGKA